MGSAFLSGPAGDESSGENQASIANGARNSSGSNKESTPYTAKQAFEVARYTFSPVTSDDDEKAPTMVYAGDGNANNDNLNCDEKD